LTGAGNRQILQFRDTGEPLGFRAAASRLGK